MALIDLPDRDAPVPRVLPGDRKIQAVLAEIQGLLGETAQHLEDIRKARFDVDPPDNESVRNSVCGLIEMPDRLRVVVQDLKTFADLVPEDHTARARSQHRIAELQGEVAYFPHPDSRLS
jgi:hypothetical protein